MYFFLAVVSKRIYFTWPLCFHCCSAVFVLSPLCFLQDTVLCEFIFAFFVPKISSFCHSEQFMSVSSSFFLPNLLHLLLLSKVLAQLASPKVAAPSMLTQCGPPCHVAARRLHSPLLTPPLLQPCACAGAAYVQLVSWNTPLSLSHFIQTTTPSCTTLVNQHSQSISISPILYFHYLLPL